MLKSACLFMLLGLTALAMAPAVAAEDAGVLCDRLAGHPDDTTLAGQGVAFGKIDTGAAEAACTQAVSEHPDEARYLFQLGRVFDKKEDFPGAVSYYERAAAKGSALAWNALGSLSELGLGTPKDYAKAAQYYKRSAEAGLLAAYRSLAYLYYHGRLPGGPEEARKLYERGAVAGDGLAVLNLGYVYEWGIGAAEDKQHAEWLFRQAIGMGKPAVAAEGKGALAWLWFDTGGDLVEAEKLAVASLAETAEENAIGKATVLDALSRIRFRLGRLEEAQRDIEEAIRLDDQYPSYPDFLGDLLAAKGEKDKAKQAWRQALALPAPTRSEDPDWNTVEVLAKLAVAD